MLDQHLNSGTAKAPSELLRVVIERVRPEVEGGRFPAKRAVGECVRVIADIYADGHDALSAAVLYRPFSQKQWIEVEMVPLENDRWEAEFPIARLESYVYTVQAWPNPFRSWVQDIGKKLAAGQELAVDLMIGVRMIEAAARRAGAQDAKELKQRAGEISEQREKQPAQAVEAAQDAELGTLMDRHADRSQASTYGKELRVAVDREKARCSAWYEMFPRSCAAEPGRHGTFHDCMQRLEYVASMGFDVLYLPPIHPIGTTFRKGKNNSPQTEPDDVGSPWAIGGAEGGHKAIHPQLGTLAEFQGLRERADELGLELAMDLAYQCTPDHPYVKEHKEWFRIRPDGTVQYAENPPKKYQDIYPLNFESEHAADLCQELKSVVEYWIGQGVRIFRVDNPHTKPFAFWEWLIEDIKAKWPETIFLAEAFTRPKVMYRLAQLGFTQSYTYFTWRTTKAELTQYFTELANPELRDFFRPNLWPNTPDILPEHLQIGGRPAFIARLVLAATLGTNYGIYGPAFELCENRALRPGSEEYLDSEKYQLRHWDIERADNLRPLIARVNAARRANPALQQDGNLRFHAVDNDQLLAYSKTSADGANTILVVVSLDPVYTQSGWLELPLAEMRLDPHHPFQVQDLLSDATYLWHGPRNYVELSPQRVPAHIFRIRRKARSERDFDYFV
jgi:starch synthase (maltosyl-transferring)